ncbi:sister chromatid cohesion protein PDS5 homolog E-like [Bidens hawaiensis]|uniref:sister chromatid cohesion protein PDS5 homolog E-like n=1 Tax=Bidens hawaiensis TaxID=980011 RepID=UPI00404947EB
MKNALRPVIKASVAQELVTHPNLDVNISLSCCFCEILRICAPHTPYDDQQLKACFEMVVVTLEKLSYASGRSYTEMGRVLEIFNKFDLSLLMLDLQLDGAGLKLRLFKQFLMVYGSNPAAIKLEMEKIMARIINESVELKLELVDCLVTFLRNTNQVMPMFH